MCCVKPQQDYQEMIKKGYHDDIPYIIWPQDIINICISEIVERKNSKLTVEFNNGKMKYNLKEIL